MFLVKYKKLNDVGGWEWLVTLGLMMEIVCWM